MLTKTEVLLTLQNENAKSYVEFDVNGRISKLYETPSTSIQGDACLVKEFIYYSDTQIVKGRKEGYGTWLSLYDSIP